MSITPGQPALASDFISTSAGAGSSGQVPKLNSGGKVDSSFLPVKFGGTGADGALAVSSGVTTFNCANAALVIKNYTSISITGTGAIQFTNPATHGTCVVFKSQGNVTLTSSAAPMLDMSGMGAPGGSAGSVGSGSQFVGGSAGSVGNCPIGLVPVTSAGPGGVTGGGSSSGGAPASLGYPATISQLTSKYPDVFVGAGGGGGGAATGSSSSCTGGSGGTGGGALIIECGGAWNFTTSSGISVAGLAGGALGSHAGSNYQQGPGGGGAGGYFRAYYNSLTANSGTVVASGGTPVTGTYNGSGFPQNISGGGGGGNSQGGGGGNASNPPSGGGGASGSSLIALNTDFS